MEIPVKNRKRILDLAGVMAGALILRLCYAVIHPLQSRDATGYLMQIRRWFHDGGVYLNSRPPLFHALVRALMFCGLDVETAALTVNIAAGTLLILPVYLIGRVIWRKHSIALAAAALAAVMPRLIRYSCLALRDGLYLHFTAWSIALWAMTIHWGETKRKGALLCSFLCGVMSAAGCMCRFEAAAFLPFAMMTLSIVAGCRRMWRQAVLAPLCLFAGVAVGVLLLTSLPGMPDIVGIFTDRFRAHLWTWEFGG